MDPTDHDEPGSSRLVIDHYSQGIYNLRYTCGKSGHDYIIRYTEPQVGRVVAALAGWVVDDDVPLTPGDMGNIVTMLIQLCQLDHLGDDEGELPGYNDLV